VQRSTLGVLLIAATIGIGLVVLNEPHPASAAKDTSLNACIVDRRGAAALMSPGPGVFFEADLRLVLGAGYSLNAGDCMSFGGEDYGDDPTVRRLFPGQGWFVEARYIDTVQDLTPNDDDD
jgi:hypothetical protein